MTRHARFSLTQRVGPFQPYSTTELIQLPPPTWLVDHVLPAGGLVGLYGRPGAGKSFLAIDLALCVAMGRPWHGHEAQKQFVLYVSAEGGTGIAKRVSAWLSSNGVSPSCPAIGWITESLPIYATSEDMAVLFRRLDEEVQQYPKLVVIDTLARCLDGDENQQEDMGRFIAGVDRMRHEWGATVIVVHHTRKSDDDERGSSAFRGAAETMLFVQRKQKNGPVVLSCNKQKDAEEFEDQTYLLHVVTAHDSCVIRDAQQTWANDILASLAYGPLSYSELLAKAHMSKASLKRGLIRFTQSGKIIKENGKWAIKGAK